VRIVGGFLLLSLFAVLGLLLLEHKALFFAAGALLLVAGGVQAAVVKLRR